MGTINYSSNNDFLTLGYNLSHYDYENDYELCEDCYEQANILLRNVYSFHHLRVEVEGGYYEGFYISIQINSSFFYDKSELEEAMKECDKLEEFLIDCINDFNVVVCHPGWGTSYESKEESIKRVKEEIPKFKKWIEEETEVYN